MTETLKQHITATDLVSRHGSLRWRRNAGGSHAWCDHRALAVLSFFGLIHGSQVGVAVKLDIVVGYLLMAGSTGFLAIRKPAENVATTVAASTAVAEVAARGRLLSYSAKAP
ncbi:MAG: hypothetical protein ACR2IK_18350 [Chloroflexota bacterium]